MPVFHYQGKMVNFLLLHEQVFHFKENFSRKTCSCKQSFNRSYTVEITFRSVDTADNDQLLFRKLIFYIMKAPCVINFQGDIRNIVVFMPESQIPNGKYSKIFKVIFGSGKVELVGMVCFPFGFCLRMFYNHLRIDERFLSQFPKQEAFPIATLCCTPVVDRCIQRSCFVFLPSSSTAQVISPWLSDKNCL